MNNTYKNIFLLLLVLALVFLVAYIGGFWFVKHTSEKASRVENEIIKKEEQRDSFESLTRLVESSRENQEILSGFYIKEDIVSFLENIESLADSADVFMNIFNVDVLPSSQYPDEIENLLVELDFAGSWGDVYSFITLIETLPEGIFTEKTSVTFVPDGGVSASKDTDGVYYPWRGQMKIRVWKIK